MTTVARAQPGVTLSGLAAVFVGGLIGTSLRFAVDGAIPNDLDEFSLATLLVNVVGALVLGVLVAALWPRVPSWFRAGLGLGILGSFTTFSALAISVVALARTGEIALAVLSIVLNIVFGMLAAWAGLTLGARLAPRPLPGTPSPAPTVPPVSEVDE